jgi:hypothetical protein
MINPKIVFIIAFVVLLTFPVQIFSQEKFGLRFNTGFTFIANHPHSGRGLDFIYSNYWTSSFRLKNHEFLAGTIYEPELWNDSYKVNYPGIILGYRFYLYKELTRFNTFYNYTFMYTINTYTVYTGHGPVSNRDDIYYAIFGCGFNIFIDKQHRLGITGTVDYPIIRDGKIFYWDRIVFTSGFTFKMPLITKKNITESKK